MSDKSEAIAFPHIVFATPRKLPRLSALRGQVVVLDIAFAAGPSGATFEKLTLPFITRLGSRLAMWVDHHDHDRHVDFHNDVRFVLATKQQHPACPEMITPALVERAGQVQTICCHVDFDGICAAAKWILGGHEPYPGADADARAIDTRLAAPGPVAAMLDRVLRAQPKSDAMRALILQYLVGRCTDTRLGKMLHAEGAAFAVLEKQSHIIAQRYQVHGQMVWLEIKEGEQYDKTLLLLLGQQRAPIAMVVHGDTVTLAAGFESGINLLQALGIAGGMPTRVSVTRNELSRIFQIFA